MRIMLFFLPIMPMLNAPIMLQETAYYALYSKFVEKMIDSYTCIEYEEKCY